MADFPRSRFAAVASEEEVEQLVAEWARSDIHAQDSLAASYAAMDEEGLRQQVAMLREAGHFDKDGVPVADEPEDEPEDEPSEDPAVEPEEDDAAPADAEEGD